MNNTHRIKVGHLWVAGFNSQYQVVTRTDRHEYIKIFSSRKSAEKFIAKYADAGYGLLSYNTSIVSL